MRLILKWLTRLMTAVVAIALIVVIAIAFTMNTQTGTRWVINRIDAAIPASIAIEEFAGTLWAGLQIPTLVYSDENRALSATEVVLDIDWASAATGILNVNVLNAESVEYRNLVKTDATPGPIEIALDPIPVSIGLGTSQIGSISLEGDGEPTVIRNLVLDNVVLRGNELLIDALSATTRDIRLTVDDLDVRLAGDVPVNLRVNWSLTDNSWSGNGSFNGSLESLQFRHSIEGPYAATASGELNILHRTRPEFDALVNWEQWEIEAYVLADGEVRIRGNIEQYDGSYALDVLLPSGENIRVSGDATGNTERLSAFDANFSNPAANANLAGSLAWQPAFTADAHIRATDFDPSVFIENLSGDLDADGDILIDGDGNVSVTNLIINGLLNDAPIDASGSITVSSELVSCNDCLVAVGDNRVSIDGTTGGAGLALTYSVNAPSLDLLWPEIGGSLIGQGRLTGSLALPRITGELHGQQLRFADWSVADVAIISRASTPENIDLTAEVTTLQQADSDLGTFTLIGKGSTDLLELQLDWTIRDLGISLAGNAQIDDESIEGVVTRAAIVETNSGTWSLDDKAGFRFRGGDLVVDRHAWSNGDGQFRVTNVSRLNSELALDAELLNLPLAISNSFLPENYQLQGSANARIDVAQSAGNWTGSMDWRQTDTVLLVRDTSGELTNISVSRAEISATLANGGATASAALTIEPGVTGELDFTLEQLSGDTPIVAEMRLQGSEWDWVPALIPTIDNFAGAISATVNASGPLSAPEFSGNLNWREGGLAVPSLNVPVTDIEVTVSGTSAGAATVSGSARAGEGDFNITGRIEELTQPTRSVRLAIKGTNAELINWPEYHLWASPDIVIAGTRDGWTINGKLEVPRADISVREIPEETVKVSSDVTVLGREEESETPTRISGETQLVLGDGVRVQAFGLETGLKGSLLIKMVNDRPLRAEGQVTLVDGVFSAYGQKLTIQEGTLTFTGALDNPLVDVRAVRVVEAFTGPVTAGIHLQGRAQSISSSVFSVPAMEEADALSYLVVGRPLSQASESDGNELSSAALALGARQATKITEQIGQTLGLDQLAIAGDGASSTALVAGKQINSRLHARYAYGVFSRLGTLILRYKMSRRLTLEAGAGEAQSINLLYTVEKQ